IQTLIILLGATLWCTLCAFVLKITTTKNHQAYLTARQTLHKGSQVCELIRLAAKKVQSTYDASCFLSQPDVQFL
ncbi:MAG TPA: hypothetical protein PKW80_03305, partial [Bacteroidales bacterium]|nr:hypothetical protein [Bacteroidales bacterium]